MDKNCSSCGAPAEHTTEQTSTHPQSGVTIHTAIWHCPKCGRLNTRVEEVKR